MINEHKLDVICEMVKAEFRSATDKNGAFNSAHEGWAVIKEEDDELWDEVKANRGYEYSAEREAIQVAAMGIRYLYDISFGNVAVDA